MQADLALKFGLNLSEYAGNYHEDSLKNNPPQEENMDKWNNYWGREIAKSIRKEYNPIQVIMMINNGKMDDIIAEKVIEKMRNGELITNPFKDKRSYQKKINGYETGYAVDVPNEKILLPKKLEECLLKNL